MGKDISLKIGDFVISKVVDKKNFNKLYWLKAYGHRKIYEITEFHPRKKQFWGKQIFTEIEFSKYKPLRQYRLATKEEIAKEVAKKLTTVTIIDFKF